MTLSPSELMKLGEVAAAAALRAGKLIREWDRSGLSVMQKDGGLSLASQVVTEVDLQSQAVILEALQPTCASYDLGLLSEECKDDGGRFEKDCFWCIDPLDGTLPFIETGRGYAVSIALVSKLGIPLIGVVYDPPADALYLAIRGAGAFRNKSRLSSVAKQPSGSSVLTFFIDNSFTTHPRFDETCARLKAAALDLGLEGIRIVEGFGAALNGCGVSMETPACYFKYPRAEHSGGSLWDFAASACIAIEAGKWVSDIFGAPLDLNRQDSTFMNHLGVLYASDVTWAKRIRKIYADL